MKLFRYFVLAGCSFVMTAPLFLLGAMAFIPAPHPAFFSISALLLPPIFVLTVQYCLEAALLIIAVLALMVIAAMLFPRASPHRRSGALVFPCGPRAPPPP
jgi:hypothetical protein